MKCRVRLDNRKRVLKEGEQQRKDGSYMFTYVDPLTRKKKYLYSWRLEKADRNPAGKKLKPSLREQENELNRKVALGTSISACTMTIEQAVNQYLESRNDVRHSTKKGYATSVKFFESQAFYKMSVSDLNIINAKALVASWQKEMGKSYSQIHNYVAVLRPAFRMLYEADMIVKNPFDFQISTVIKNNMKKRDALSTEDMKIYLNYVKNDEHYKKYYPVFYVLFYTGLRVSELCGLTLSDINLDRKEIKIGKQLIKVENGNYLIIPLKMKKYDISRVISLNEELVKQFKILIENRAAVKNEIIVKDEFGNEYKEFLLLDKSNTPCVANNIESWFKWCYNKYDRLYKHYIPRVTPHVCRHTYATELYRRGVSIKSAQYLLGHSSPDITARIYVDTDQTRANDELAQKFKADIIEEVGNAYIDLDD